jgi:hypothetical protein
MLETVEVVLQNLEPVIISGMMVLIHVYFPEIMPILVVAGFYILTLMVNAVDLRGNQQALR